MNRPSKKEIREAVQKLKEVKPNESAPEAPSVKLTPKQSSKRIRKQGI